MAFWILIAFFGSISSCFALEVTLLTPAGPKVLKSWTPAELKTVSGRRGQVSAQKLIFDESTQNLELNERANIDLVTLYGANNRIARVPRFLVWRGFFKLSLDAQGNLNSRGEPDRLLVPSPVFTVEKINKIELSRASFTYPGTRLTLRTNPAASRGEKLYTQSCLACHSLPQNPVLSVPGLTDAKLADFNAKHKLAGGLVLDAKATRGLAAYRDALIPPVSEVKSPQ